MSGGSTQTELHAQAGPVLALPSDASDRSASSARKKRGTRGLRRSLSDLPKQTSTAKRGTARTTWLRVLRPRPHSAVCWARI